MGQKLLCDKVLSIATKHGLENRPQGQVDWISVFPFSVPRKIYKYSDFIVVMHHEHMLKLILISATRLR